MNVTDALKNAGYEVEKSTVGDKPIFAGTYKATLFDVALMEDKGYGQSIYAQFKVQETLEGISSHSKFPEFKGYFSLAPESIASKRKGLAKLLNGLFSVGVEVDASDVVQSLISLKGTVVFLSGFAKEPRKNIGTKEVPNWVDDPDGEVKQDFAFLTEKNAMKRIKSAAAPF